MQAVRALTTIETREGSDGKIYVTIEPLGIETFAKDEAELRIAIVEAVLAFGCIAQLQGEDLIQNLEELGYPIEVKTFTLDEKEVNIVPRKEE